MLLLVPNWTIVTPYFMGTQVATTKATTCAECCRATYNPVPQIRSYCAGVN